MPAVSLSNPSNGQDCALRVVFFGGVRPPSLKLPPSLRLWRTGRRAKATPPYNCGQCRSAFGHAALRCLESVGALCSLYYSSAKSSRAAKKSGAGWPRRGTKRHEEGKARFLCVLVPFCGADLPGLSLVAALPRCALCALLWREGFGGLKWRAQQDCAPTKTALALLPP